MYRPVSPHLTIYSAQTSSVFSVFHRATASVLSLSIFFLFFLTEFCISNINFYSVYLVSFLFNTSLAWLVMGALLVVIFSFFYHLSNGIRHLIWDFTDLGFNVLNKKSMSFTALVVSLSTLSLFVVYVLSF
jgi:succinate dehydrogenase / fumarate reductase cytochrome b subunit